MCRYVENTNQFDRDVALLYARLDGHTRRIETARSRIREALNLSRRPAISFSSGKDSIVLLDLMHQEGFNGPMFLFTYGKGNTECSRLETPSEICELAGHYADKWDISLEKISCLGESDLWERIGRFATVPKDDAEKKVFSLVNNDFRQAAADYERAYDIDVQFIGMCKHESKRRRMMLTKKNWLYTVVDKGPSVKRCCPLMDLTPEDIWAYIYSHELPYLSIYDYPYLDRCRNRNEITMCYNDAIMRHGMLEHYRAMYPEYIAAIERRWGRIG